MFPQMLLHAMTQSYALLIHSPFEPFDLHVDASSGATTCICAVCKQRLFSKSSGHMFASQADNHGCLLPASELLPARLHSSGPAFRVPERHREDAQSSSDVRPSTGNSSFFTWDRLNRSFFCSPQLLLDCCRMQQRLLPTCAYDPHCVAAEHVDTTIITSLCTADKARSSVKETRRSTTEITLETTVLQQRILARRWTQELLVPPLLLRLTSARIEDTLVPLTWKIHA